MFENSAHRLRFYYYRHICNTQNYDFVTFQLVELKRNPQGAIDKRVRATLKPMGTKRRDSSELEERLRDAKTQNQRSRKILLEREAELQALLRRMGSDENRLAPPQPEVNQIRSNGKQVQ